MPLFYLPQTSRNISHQVEEYYAFREIAVFGKAISKNQELQVDLQCMAQYSIFSTFLLFAVCQAAATTEKYETVGNRIGKRQQRTWL